MADGFYTLVIGLSIFLLACDKEKKDNDHTNSDERIYYSTDQFVMGADLSYVNQIVDHNGIYMDSGEVKNPYTIFKNNGTNLVRLRLWHNPAWTKDVYGDQGNQLYNDLKDVERSISEARGNGMAVLLDFHYSDSWADPGKQVPPDAWKNITSLDVLQDSVYQYTKNTLLYLKNKGLFPEMVQIGNEINCGLLTTGTVVSFPDLNVCEGKWTEQGAIINAGIQAVREAGSGISPAPQVILHVADPKNLEWWFEKIINEAGVSDFDVIGFSYYPLWHTDINYSNVPAIVTSLKTQYNKKVMVLETAYPWTTENADSYNNLLGSQPLLENFSFTPEGQKDFMIDFTQKMIDAGASGIVYWEPAWITSEMKDLWGTGSSWENSALFDFEGNALASFAYMTFPYVFER